MKYRQSGFNIKDAIKYEPFLISMNLKFILFMGFEIVVFWEINKIKINK